MSTRRARKIACARGRRRGRWGKAVSHLFSYWCLVAISSASTQTKSALSEADEGFAVAFFARSLRTRRGSCFAVAPGGTPADRGEVGRWLDRPRAWRSVARRRDGADRGSWRPRKTRSAAADGKSAVTAFDASGARVPRLVPIREKFDRSIEVGSSEHPDPAIASTSRARRSSVVRARALPRVGRSSSSSSRGCWLVGGSRERASPQCHPRGRPRPRVTRGTMPALNLFGRTWLVATDDLPIPMMCLMVVHTVWCAPTRRAPRAIRTRDATHRREA